MLSCNLLINTGLSIQSELLLGIAYFNCQCKLPFSHPISQKTFAVVHHSAGIAAI